MLPFGLHLGATELVRMLRNCIVLKLEIAHVVRLMETLWMLVAAGASVTVCHLVHRGASVDHLAYECILNRLSACYVLGDLLRHHS
jgi:hypothetical protein